MTRSAGSRRSCARCGRPRVDPAPGTTVPRPEDLSTLDLNVSAGRAGDERLPALTAEAERLTALGASVLSEGAELGDVWIVMQDPEGNDFCLQ
ncbi:VOC family protein [Isoptericola rhizosphaerae]|uniref:VOC family protein n=1 Tax=Isoptericola rhizosphaerae TaxID=3377837 RepID=UPI00383B437D